LRVVYRRGQRRELGDKPDFFLDHWSSIELSWTIRQGH
jgi:hypothetical protein